MQTSVTGNRRARAPELPSTSAAFPIETRTAGFDGPSSLTIVPVPSPGRSAAPVGADSLTVNASFGSTCRSPLTSTDTTPASVPAGIVSVPDFADEVRARRGRPRRRRVDDRHRARGRAGERHREASAGGPGGRLRPPTRSRSRPRVVRRPCSAGTVSRDVQLARSCSPEARRPAQSLANATMRPSALTTGWTPPSRSWPPGWSVLTRLVCPSVRS